ARDAGIEANGGIRSAIRADRRCARAGDGMARRCSRGRSALGNRAHSRRGRARHQRSDAAAGEARARHSRNPRGEGVGMDEMTLRRLEQAMVREQIERYNELLARLLYDIAADPRLGPHVAAAARRNLDDMRRALLEEYPY